MNNNDSSDSSGLRLAIDIALVVLFAWAVINTNIDSHAHLYPANELAQRDGALTANFTPYTFGSDNGDITIPMPDGEILTGEYSYVSETLGIASTRGNVGTSINCEFNKDRYRPHGTGSCKGSNGALYQLQY